MQSCEFEFAFMSTICRLISELLHCSMFWICLCSTWFGSCSAIIAAFPLFLLLMLVAAGLNSVIERTLLAWWQLRQAPTMSPAFGFSTFLMDGAKLFAKASCFLEFRLGYGFILCAAVFAGAYLSVVLVFPHVGLLFS